MEEDVNNINSKIDHMMRVVCETFIVVKSLEKYDTKLDHCLTALNRLSARVDRLEHIEHQSQPLSVHTRPTPSKPKPPRGPTMPSIQDQLISELKGKLKGKKIT